MPRAFCRRLERGQRQLQHLVEIDLLGVDGISAALQFRDIEDIVDHGEQVPASRMRSASDNLPVPVPALLLFAE
jgi:hypothetical protein